MRARECLTPQVVWKQRRRKRWGRKYRSPTTRILESSTNALQVLVDTFHICFHHYQHPSSSSSPSSVVALYCHTRVLFSLDRSFPFTHSLYVGPPLPPLTLAMLRLCRHHRHHHRRPCPSCVSVDKVSKYLLRFSLWFHFVTPQQAKHRIDCCAVQPRFSNLPRAAQLDSTRLDSTRLPACLAGWRGLSIFSAPHQQHPARLSILKAY